MLTDDENVIIDTRDVKIIVKPRSSADVTASRGSSIEFDLSEPAIILMTIMKEVTTIPIMGTTMRKMEVAT